MDHWEKLAENVKLCETQDQKEKYVTETIDQLKVENPTLVSMMAQQMHAQEVEANDPKLITEWLNPSKPFPYKKFHQALLLVNVDDIMVKDLYRKHLKRMLCSTIETKAHVAEAVKICYLIESTPYLTSIHK